MALNAIEVQQKNPSERRPDHGPTQVRHPDEIKTGGNYIVHAINPKEFPVHTTYKSTLNLLLMVARGKRVFWLEEKYQGYREEW